MSDIDDPVIRQALEYEAATLEMLRTIVHEEEVEQLKAFERWYALAAENNKLTVDDYNRAGFFLGDRGKIPEDAVDTIIAAMERLDAAHLRTAKN